ncbi:NHS-like protein 2 [Periophthalmus magnuspinnatus]|uniref:NHS-like protein 2 n=1 Tax=Periophthalmus magnuspinnatus TaxID=409849 RepID=UPI00243635C0|nr:NHS-like protein 2 [Periophthalmus magnuspinnatus]
MFKPMSWRLYSDDLEADLAPERLVSVSVLVSELQELDQCIPNFEEQLCDSKPGQTFRLPSSSQSSEETSLTRSPASPGSPGSSGKRTDFIFLPASKQLYDDETASSVFGLRSILNASPCGSERPLQLWGTHSSSGPPPVAEKPRWTHGRRTPAQFIPLDITGETGGGGGGGGGGRFHGVDLLQHSPCPSPAELPHQPRSLEPVTDTLHQGAPLRKTHSDLEAALTPDPPEQRHSDLSPGAMDHSGLLCSWNGPKGSTFSPGAWNEPYNHHNHNYHSTSTKGPAVPPKQHTVVGGCIQALPPEPRAPVGARSETEGGEASRGRQRSARSIAAANAFKFRERSLSTPTDSDSFGFDGRLPTGNGTNDQRHNNYLGTGENYALLYPSGSSEDSASTTDTISVTASDYSNESRLRLRSRSISLKKSKRKPPPPVRSVSLMKNLGEAEGRVHQGRGLYRDGRPKSLHIPRDQYHDFQPDFLMPNSGRNSRGDGVEERRVERPPSLEIQAPDQEGETEFTNHWQLGEWKNNNDPYRSLSGSSTATGTTVLECMKVRDSSESLRESPSTSRATSPLPLAMETDHKASSPFRPPHGLMSPSSGYSSQSEAPTPTVPHQPGTAHATVAVTGCKLRPKIPERKSSLPSPKDPAARSRLSFEMPGNAHLELSSLKPKQRANRRHSDTSTAEKPGKISPSSSQALPVVTQNELKTIRLRSVSRGDLEDCPDGASDTIEEEHGRDIGENPSPPPTLPKPRPPVAIKPPLPKRPMNLQLKPPSPSSTPLSNDSPPASPIDRPVPLGNIYKVMKKPKPKKTPPQVPASPDVNSNTIQNYETQFMSPALFDLPPLPDPQPLLEDPGLEPEFDPDPELRLGDGGSLPSPCSTQETPELQDKSRTLPPRTNRSSGAEIPDRKKPKVPPPVPKKPRCVIPTPTHASNGGSSERPSTQGESPMGARCPLGALPPDDRPTTPRIPEPLPTTHQVPDPVPEEYPRRPEEQPHPLQHPWEYPLKEHPHPPEEHPGEEQPLEEHPEELQEDSSKESSLQDSSLSEVDHKMAAVDIGADETTASDASELQVSEEAEDVLSCSTHTTEDLFTIIHRSKRKVLGRKEPSDSFGSRQNLSSPVKNAPCGSDLRSYTLSSSQRSTSRNENFMALLQKKGNKSSSCGTRVSAMELLRSTNPLARRVTEFSAANANDDAKSATSNCNQ